MNCQSCGGPIESGRFVQGATFCSGCSLPAFDVRALDGDFTEQMAIPGGLLILHFFEAGHVVDAVGLEGGINGLGTGAEVFV